MRKRMERVACCDGGTVVRKRLRGPALCCRGGVRCAQRLAHQPLTTGVTATGGGEIGGDAAPHESGRRLAVDAGHQRSQPAYVLLSRSCPNATCARAYVERRQESGDARPCVSLRRTLNPGRLLERHTQGPLDVYCDCERAAARVNMRRLAYMAYNTSQCGHNAGNGLQGLSTDTQKGCDGCTGCINSTGWCWEAARVTNNGDSAACCA
ncbi:hypothetical protein B0H14DRAFT_2767787 [Mycena olivaceomarginata]|nr:hypothetical protein B0H14DRAFT_2767787 [Mycena olivaceomarginata]